MKTIGKAFDDSLKRTFEEKVMYEPLSEKQKGLTRIHMAIARGNLERKGILRPKDEKSLQRCKECQCLLQRDYSCRHRCQLCIKSEPENEPQ